MSIVSRRYEGHADLARMVELEKEIAAARWPELPRWHAGDVVWNAYILDAGSDRARLWFDGEAPIAYGLLASPDEIQVAVHPRLANDDALFNRIMEWAESTVQAWVGPGAGATVGILVKERDSDLTRRVAARGYVRQDHGGTFLRRSLQTAIGEQPLPPGMRVIDCIDVDVEERAAAHRDAWSHLEHLGMGAVRSSFTTERYRRLRATPGYDAGLDLGVALPDGTIAACCICWADERNGTGHFEPVGTRFDYRRQGLARALILEGLRRFRERGLHTAYIGTASFNHPAEAAYLSCGFEIADRGWSYEKELAIS